jgi:hypothetical protein
MTNHSQPTLNDVQFAYDISLRYAPVIEDCLNSKVLSLPPLELILLHKDIFNDPEFSQRMRSARKAFLAEHPEIAGAQAQLIECKYDLMRMVAADMTKEEKRALVQRIMARTNLKLT